MTRRILVWSTACLLVGSFAAAARACIGDCDENGAVTVDEIVIGTSIVLGTITSDACFAFRHFAGEVDVADLVAGLRSALEGCPSYVEIDRLRAARARWQAQDIDSYTMRYVRSCFCPPPNAADIVVRNGAIESVTDVASGEAVAVDTSGIWGFLPVDALFAAIEAALGQADVTTIAYDDELGYPTNASFDFLRGAVDDELSVAITNLQPLP